MSNLSEHLLKGLQSVLEGPIEYVCKVSHNDQEINYYLVVGLDSLFFIEKDFDRIKGAIKYN